MFSKLLFVFHIYIMMLVGLPAVAAAAVSLIDKTQLQAVMQQHVDRQLVAGAFLHLDPKTGDVVELHPEAAHPVILEMGEHFVLCYDFRTTECEAVEVDFYLARTETSFVVFQTLVENPDILKKLMKEGRVTRAD